MRGKNKLGKSIGLVPTMGALHNGHASLLQTSLLENDLTVCSIFVNPTQFNNHVDLEKYPRTFDLDAEVLKKVGCDVLFLPTVASMYPMPATLSFDFKELGSVMEGHFRPGHFSGVALVVSKLFNIIQPTAAYFGQKDWQQFAIIRQLAEDLNFPIDIKSVPTTREPDGLALSSRNKRLTENQRAQAIIFYQCLSATVTELSNGVSFSAAKTHVEARVKNEPDVQLEYLELADSINLKAVSGVEEAYKPILCIAGYVGEIRLIDNMFIHLSSI